MRITYKKTAALALLGITAASMLAGCEPSERKVLSSS